MRPVGAGVPGRVIRIAYFGLPLAALLLAADGFAPSLVVLSPAEAPGRRRLRRTLASPVLDARDFPDAAALDFEVLAALSREPPDLVVSWYWTRRLSGGVLSLPRLGGVGVHPSLLPRHRGPNPFFATIDAGDADTGVTVHRLTPAYDEGDVLAQEVLPVDDRDAWQLARALDRPSLRQLRRVVGLIAQGRSPAAVPQSAALATWAPEPTGNQLRVDFSWPTEQVLRRIRALSPVPGVAIEIRGVELFVTGARATTRFPLALVPGEAARTAEGVAIRTGDGAVLLTRAQAAAAGDSDVVEIQGVDIGERLALGDPVR